LSFALQSRDESSDIFLIYIPPKLFSAQDFVEFSKEGKGKQTLFCFSSGAAES